MSRAKLECLQPGMVVTGDVKNMDGMLLIPAGCALSEKHIHILSAWGVPEIDIELPPEMEEPEKVPAVPPEVMEKLLRELQAAFWEPAKEGSVQAAILDLAVRRKVRHYQTR